MAAIATADHVQRKFGNVLALSDVTFELQKGVTGLLGANGAAKTTLISLFLSVLRPDAGKLALLRRVATDLGFPVPIPAHLLGEVERASDFIGMLEGGRVARSGSMKGLLGGDTPMVVEVVSGAKRLAAFLSSKGFAATAKDDLRLTVPASAEGVQDAIVAGRGRPGPPIHPPHKSAPPDRGA